MITKEQIIKILKSYSTYTDRSRTDECVHESNFDLIAKDVVKKLTIPVVDCQREQLVCCCGRRHETKELRSNKCGICCKELIAN